MNRTAVQLIAKSGLIPEELLQQFYKWKLLDDVGSIEQPQTASELVARINSILEEDGMQMFRMTDIDILQRYMATQEIGDLVVSEGVDGQSTMFEVAYGRTLTGEIIFPWRGDNVANLMTNGLTHLLVKRVVKNLKVVTALYFCEVKEMYFGSTKAFMICQPSTAEQPGEQHVDAD